MLHQLIQGKSGKVFHWGNTVPADATTGYAPGCIFVHDDGSAGGQLYVNRGSVTSANFDEIPTADDANTFSAAQSIGTQANVVGSGLTIATATPGALRVFSDDAGASIADSVRGIQSRFLLTFDQAGGTIRALQGQLKLLTGIDVTTGIYTAVQGYVEMAATHSCKTGATFSCVDASAEIGTALTVDSGGEFCGIHVETTGAGTITNNGTCAGILIDKASGAASWPDAILVDGPSVIKGFRIGKFVGSAGVTTQVLFATTQNVYADGQLSTCEIHGASNANLTSAYAAHCLRARHVVNCTTAAHETYGVMGQLVVKGTTLSHMHAGLMGTFEGHTSGVVVNAAYTYGVAAIIARVGGGATITATTCLSGVSSILNGPAVASGTSSAFSCDATSTADWDYGMSLANCTRAFNFVGACVSAVTAGSSSSNLQILIHVNGSAYALAVCAVGT